jgi:hypothetical protein
MVGLDDIDIFNNDGASYRLDISDFENYDDRMLIKEKFLSNCIVVSRL